MTQLRWLKVFGICVLVLSLSVSFARAVDLHPETKQRLIESGRWEQYKQTVLAARAAGVDQPNTRTRGTKLAGSATTAFGSRIPCILVEFSDNLWADGAANTSPGLVDSMLFSEGEYATGSFREYYLENSYGAFAATGEVIGPLMMPQTYLYYVGDNRGIGDSPHNSQTLARDAILAADPIIDFSQYDVDGNNEVDGVMIIFAGFGFEEAADEESQTMQSHQWVMVPGLNLDGFDIREYTVQPEEHGRASGISGTNGIGVWCHEWGHILGLPDLYDLDFSSWGIGRWSIMANGNYLNNSNTPSHFDPWCKAFLGWVSVINLQENRVDQAIPAYATTPTVYRLWMPGLTGQEYFLVCNRHQTGFDAALPGSGLLILHCDNSEPDNRNEYIPGVIETGHYYKVAVVQADGNYDLERYEGGNPGDAGDLYTDKTVEFDDLTTPGSRGYFGIKTQVAVWNISPTGPTMTANLDVTYSRPLIIYINHYFEDSGGDDDGAPDPGETVEMMITTQNLWKAATNIVVTVSSSCPEVVFAANSFTIAELGSGEYYLNYGEDAIVFSIPATLQPTIADFYINYSAEGGAFTFAETLSVDLGPKQVLIVDDDAYYKLTDYDHYYTSALETLRIPYEVHHKDTQGSPPAAVLGSYPMVCWYTGYTDPNRSDPLLQHADVVALQEYLDAGGRLFLTGQNIAQNMNADSTFVIDYLGVRYAPGMPIIMANGVADDPISDGHVLPLGGPGGAANQNSPDILELIDGLAVLAYTYYGSSDIAGVHVDAGHYRAVFLGFGVEAIADGLPGYTKRRELISSVIYWLIGLSTGILAEDETEFGEFAEQAVPTKYTLFQNYPNPFNGRTIIEFSVAPGQSGDVSIDIIDILGRRVTTIFRGIAIPGIHRVEWDGRDNSGRNVSSGVYFYRILDRDGTGQSRRMVYLK